MDKEKKEEQQCDDFLFEQQLDTMLNLMRSSIELQKSLISTILTCIRDEKKLLKSDAAIDKKSFAAIVDMAIGATGENSKPSVNHAAILLNILENELAAELVGIKTKTLKFINDVVKEYSIKEPTDDNAAGSKEALATADADTSNMSAVPANERASQLYSEIKRHLQDVKVRTLMSMDDIISENEKKNPKLPVKDADNLNTPPMIIGRVFTEQAYEIFEMELDEIEARTLKFIADIIKENEIKKATGKDHASADVSASAASATVSVVECDDQLAENTNKSP